MTNPTSLCRSSHSLWPSPYPTPSRLFANSNSPPAPTDCPPCVQIDPIPLLVQLLLMILLPLAVGKLIRDSSKRVQVETKGKGGRLAG